jgi:hypothetical protein
VNLSINPFGSGSSLASPSLRDASSSSPNEGGGVPCPNCGGNVVPVGTGWQSCPSCANRLQACLWPVIRQSTKTAVAISDQATCFFHPDKAFQACCQRCGRFVCTLCDLQLGTEHVCPACFERGRSVSGAGASKAEWRHRDVLYDSIALMVGWVWIIFWPTTAAALPSVITLHIKFRKAPRSYLIPRSGWRFWVAYVGLLWAPLLIGFSLLAARTTTRH